MKELLPILRPTELFAGMEDREILDMLACMKARVRRVKKGVYLAHLGEKLSHVGMIVQGAVQLEREDYWGSRSILAKVGPGELFGEVYACMPGHALNISILTVSDTQVLSLDIGKVINVCDKACPFHNRLVQNLLGVLAAKAYMLTRKMEHVSRRTTREKLLSYLSAEALGAGGGAFSIPFNRQELADYLAVDRSAMSSELSKMRGEGLIDYEKNRFTLCRAE